MRRLAPALLAALVLAVPSVAAAQEPQLLMPGVTLDTRVQFTLRGPVVAHVLTAPRPGGLYSLQPVLSNGTIGGLEKLTDMQKDVSSQGTTAGVNGDRFQPDGRPVGILMRNGALDFDPIPARSSIGIGADGTLRVDQVGFYGIWKGKGPRRPLVGVNPKAGASMAIYTPAWGATTPPQSGVVEAVLEPFGPLVPGQDVSGTVTQAAATNGGTPIPADGAVLVAKGGVATQALQAEAPVGSTVAVRVVFRPAWEGSGVVGAIGGGPLLVQNGHGVSNAAEVFDPGLLVPRTARTAVGQKADGSIVMVVVDGGNLGYSVGMTNFELAQLMVSLGCQTAAALDSGDSSAMAFDGNLVSRPSGAAGERAVSDSLNVVFQGVYAPPPTEPTLSPNGDGVAEVESLSYRIPRPSSVRAQLVGPDGQARLTDTGSRQPGVYPLTWNGHRPDGTLDTEGVYHWSVIATDDLGRTSSIDRTFTLDDTLGFLAVKPTLVRINDRGSPFVATFELTRPATVTATIESRSGALVRTLARAQSAAPGRIALTWDGRDDRQQVAFSGVYVLRVQAVSSVGTSQLVETFRARHVGVASKPVFQVVPPKKPSGKQG